MELIPVTYQITTVLMVHANTQALLKTRLTTEVALVELEAVVEDKALVNPIKNVQNT